VSRSKATKSSGAWGRDSGVHNPWDRVRWGGALLAAVTVAGAIGYTLLGLTPLDALYQAVTTISTVGFTELGARTTAWKVFTILLVLFGTGAVLYTLTVLFETLVEGRVTDLFWRRRMERELAEMKDHVIICGCGRLGRTVAEYVFGAGRDLVVVDADPARTIDLPYPHVDGDATDDEVLMRAGLERASTLIAAVDGDAGNLFVTLTARSARPDLFIITRARVESAEAKMRQAGADRVINPQHLGGTRIGAMTLQPHVADFVDVVMHDGSLEFRLEEVPVPAGSPLSGQTLRALHVRDRTGAMVLALRRADGTFLTNPSPDAPIDEGAVLIAIGTSPQLAALSAMVLTGRDQPVQIVDPARPGR
jgi:voltage-gated potassium channel